MCRRKDEKSALFRCSNQVEADLDNLKILLLLLLQCTHYNSVSYSTPGSGRGGGGGGGAKPNFPPHDCV